MLLAFYVCERYDEELCLEIVHGLEKRLLEDLLLWPWPCSLPRWRVIISRHLCFNTRIRRWAFSSCFDRDGMLTRIVHPQWSHAMQYPAGYAHYRSEGPFASYSTALVYEGFTLKKSSGASSVRVWNSNIWALRHSVPLFRDTNMAAVTSRENTLFGKAIHLIFRFVSVMRFLLPLTPGCNMLAGFTRNLCPYASLFMAPRFLCVYPPFYLINPLPLFCFPVSCWCPLLYSCSSSPS